MSQIGKTVLYWLESSEDACSFQLCCSPFASNLLLSGALDNMGSCVIERSDMLSENENNRPVII